MAKKKPAKKKPAARKAKAKKTPVKKAPKKAKPASKAKAPKIAEGTVVWMGLNTPNKLEAARFYRQVLRLQSKTVPMGDDTMMILSAGDTDVAHVSEMVEDRGPRWMTFFYVDDIDAAAAEAAKAGGKIQVPPMDIEEGRFCVMLDPHGVEFAVFKPH